MLSLAFVPIRVLLLRFPGDGVKDASDWIAAGGTIEELAKLADSAPQAKATKPIAENEVSPMISPIMEQWRDLTHQIVDGGRVDVLTPGGPWRGDGSRAMQCPMSGHKGQEETKPSAWIAGEG